MVSDRKGHGTRLGEKDNIHMIHFPTQLRQTSPSSPNCILGFSLSFKLCFSGAVLYPQDYTRVVVFGCMSTLDLLCRATWSFSIVRLCVLLSVYSKLD